MRIASEQDMNAFCATIDPRQGHLQVVNYDKFSDAEVTKWERFLEKYDPFPEAELKQGIEDISLDGGVLRIEEVPRLIPFAKTPDESYKGPMTGVLVNCIDRQRMLVLFQLRGKGIDEEKYGFQNAAAGFGRFREHLGLTARRELAEETGIQYPRVLFDEMAVDILPFMCLGFPQPLASFAVQSDLSRFQQCADLDAILEFRTGIIEKIKRGQLQKQEGYHFAVPYDNVEQVAGQLHEQGRFYGPIHQSILNFQKALKDSGVM